MTALTVNEITKTVEAQDLVQAAQKRFKDISEKGGVTAQAVNFNLENASLREMDFTLTEDYKELGIVKHLEIPTGEGRIIYSYNDTAHSLQTYKKVDGKKGALLNLVKGNKDFKEIVEYIANNGGKIDYDFVEATHYTRELSDSEDILEYHILTAIVRETETNEAIGQVQYTDIDDHINLLFGEEKVSVEDEELTVTAAASCAVSWMNCMLRCLCGATSGSCAIAVSGCIGACCGCTGWVACIPCAGCVAGVAACGNKCSSSK